MKPEGGAVRPKQSIIYLGHDARTEGVLRRGFGQIGAADSLLCTERLPADTQIQTCDFMIVDLDGVLPQGFRLFSRWSRVSPLLRLLAMVRQGDVGTAVQAMRYGAADCIEKPVNPAGVKAIVEGFLCLTDPGIVSMSGRLTKTERIVLAGILQGGTTSAIAASMHRSPRTVEVHRKNIKRKLRASTLVDLVIAQYRQEQLFPVGET